MGASTAAAADATVAPADVSEHLVAQGRYWATTAELERLTGEQAATLRKSLGRLVHQGKLFSPARGLYVVVPAEYRSWRVVPAEWFVDPLMKHLKREYYVGFLSAASLHGASHQHPQTFRVVTDRRLPDRDIERVRLRFTQAEHVSKTPTEQRAVPTGYMRVATKESTLADLAWRPALGGGISNVATVIKEIGEIDTEALARAAQLRDQATSRRLGYLLARLRPELDLHWLAVVARPTEGGPVRLAPGARRGSVDQNWGVLVNAPVEPDV